MSQIHITKDTESFIRVKCEADISREICDKFTYWVDGYRFMPSFKQGWFDGKIRLFNRKTGQILSGLRTEIEEFAKEKKYHVTYGSKFGSQEFSELEAIEFIKSLNLSERFTPREHQLRAFIKAVRVKRMLMLSPTNSGKSLIIYLLIQYYKTKKILLIVPDTGLVHQMKADLIEYGADEREMHSIYAGQNKFLDRRVTISTWQSLMNVKDDSYFEKYDVVISDECHLSKATEVKKVITKCVNAEYRFGTTGSINDIKLNMATLTGLFGPFYQVTTNKILIDKGISADLSVKGLVLKYSDEDRQLVSNMEWTEELDWIVTNPKRNKFIKNLALSLKGNTVIMVKFKEKHGKVLFDLLESANSGRKIYYISGDDDAKERHELRAVLEKEVDAIIVASEGVFSRGVSIKALHNLIKSSPSKGKELTLQSLGRMLRVSETKSKATLFDIGDDLSFLGKVNITLRHYFIRMKIYKEEKFKIKVYNIDVT